jgi:hypothetical protein
MARSAEFKDRMARRVISETRAVRAYSVQRNERAVFWYGRVLSMGAFEVPRRVWGHRCEPRSLGACEAASRVYLFIMWSVRRAVVYWILGATRKLGLIKDVAVHIAKMVFASRSEGGWWIRDSPFEALPEEVLEKVFCRIQRLRDWGALARTCTRFSKLTSFSANGEELFESVCGRLKGSLGTRALLQERVKVVRKVKLFRSAGVQAEEVYIAVVSGTLIVARSDCTGMCYFDAGMDNEHFGVDSVTKSKEELRVEFVIVAGEEKQVFVAEFESDALRDETFLFYCMDHLVGLHHLPQLCEQE